MGTLRDLFAKLYAYVLLFEQTEFQEETQPSYEQVHGEITALLEEQKAKARSQRLDRDYQDALFAFVAWADETILKHKTWQHRRRWNNQLQNEYFQTRNAGREFFDKLGGLPVEQKEVREIYYTSLGLGFSGQYFRDREDALKLQQKRHEQTQHLPLPIENVQDIDKLTPQPYQVPIPEGKPIKPPLTRLFLRVALGLLIAVPMTMFVIYRLRAPSLPETVTVTPPPPKKEETVKPPVQLTSALIMQRLADAQKCAKVSVKVDTPTGVVSLTGRVTSDVQGREIRSIVQNIEEVTQVEDTFRIIPWPFCEVLELLEPVQAHAQAQAFGLEMRLNKAGEPASYVNGENLVIELQAPAFDSYVYVDYYTAVEGDGANSLMAHIMPNPDEPNNHLPARTSSSIGDDPDPRKQKWQISPPFGLELVVVIASKTPLFPSRNLELGENTEAYLQALRQALQEVNSSDVAATFQFIKTRQQ